MTMHMFEGFISNQCDIQARDHPGTDPGNHNRFVVLIESRLTF